MEELWFNKAGNTGMPHADPDGSYGSTNKSGVKLSQYGRDIYEGPRTNAIALPQQNEAERLERIAVQEKDFLDCSKELGLDKKVIDIAKIKDSYARRKALGILPRAPYGCMTKECEEQNRASSRSEIDFKNSELGKQFDCLEKCAKNKRFLRESNAGLAILKRKGKDTTGATKMMEKVNYRYNSECPSFKKAKKKTNYLPWVLGGVVILLLLKK